MSKSEALRQQILALVQEYYEAEHSQQSFTPGETEVPVSGRVFDAAEMVNLVDSSLEFWLTTGRYADQFEQEFARWMGVRHAILCNSGSSANLLALSALTSPKLAERQLKPGDEVITVAAGFPTTVNPIVQNQLMPVFLDIELGTYNVDVTQLETAVSPRTKAIMIAHTLGNPFNLDAVLEVANKHDLWLIEDNCDAVGATYNGRLTGSFGHLASVSFYPAHHITMGEGGCVLTNRAQLKKLVESFRDWGRDCWCEYDNPVNGKCGLRFDREIPGMPGYYDHRYFYSEIGYNLKLTDPQAAMGVAQLDKLPAFIAARKRNFAYLYDALQEFEEFLLLPTWHTKADPSWFAFPILVRDEAPFLRHELTRFLEAHKVETRTLFAGNILKQPGYQGINCRVVGDLPVADQIMRGVFFVGVYPGLDVPRLDYVIETFASFFRRL